MEANSEKKVKEEGSRGNGRRCMSAEVVFPFGKFPIKGCQNEARKTSW